jgi:hypothetical protein
MKHLFTLLALCSFGQAKTHESVISEKFLDSVAMIESNFNPNAVGDKGKALGAYQLHQEAWIDACKWMEFNDKGTFADNYSWLVGNITDQWKTRAKDPVISRIVAKAYFLLLYYRFQKRGIKPTDIQLYMAYNMGFGGAAQKDFVYNSYKLDDARACILKRANYILSR